VKLDFREFPGVGEELADSKDGGRQGVAPTHFEEAPVYGYWTSNLVIVETR
jgi:hypothetical protein